MLFRSDRSRPARITDVVARAVSNTSAEVRFTHTGEDSLTGTAARLELRIGRLPLGEGNFETEGVLVRDVTPHVAGSPDTLVIPGLPEGATRWFALRATDAHGLRSAISNSDSVALPGVAPAIVKIGRAHV